MRCLARQMPEVGALRPPLPAPPRPCPVSRGASGPAGGTAHQHPHFQASQRPPRRFRRHLRVHSARRPTEPIRQHTARRVREINRQHPDPATSRSTSGTNATARRRARHRPAFSPVPEPDDLPVDAGFKRFLASYSRTRRASSRPKSLETVASTTGPRCAPTGRAYIPKRGCAPTNAVIPFPLRGPLERP